MVKTGANRRARKGATKNKKPVSTVTKLERMGPGRVNRTSKIKKVTTVPYRTETTRPEIRSGKLIYRVKSKKSPPKFSSIKTTKDRVTYIKSNIK